MAAKTILFVDDEPAVLQRLRPGFESMRPDWEVHYAGNGPEALKFLKRKRVDVVICDLLMPGMNGAEFLIEVEKHHPQTVRISLTGDSPRETELKLRSPAHQYLTKHSDAALLHDTIRRSVACFNLHDVLLDKKIRELIMQVQWLPALPSIYLKLLDELRKDEPSMDRIGEIISHDPGMTADILHLVNSAFFGAPQKMTNPKEAAIYLGLDTLKALVLAQQAFVRFVPPRIKEFSYDFLWQHCWTVGVLARRIAIAQRADRAMLDDCFTAGLLHDVGKLILVNNLPEKYRQVLLLGPKERLALWQSEQRILGANHSGVGAYLLSLWGLPDSIVEAVALHHTPELGNTERFSVTTAVHVANCFDHEKRSMIPDDPERALAEEYLETLGLTDRIDPWRERCFATVE